MAVGVATCAYGSQRCYSYISFPLYYDVFENGDGSHDVHDKNMASSAFRCVKLVLVIFCRLSFLLLSSLCFFSWEVFFTAPLL